jgi:uncharacterized caspase-like protein
MTADIDRVGLLAEDSAISREQPRGFFTLLEGVDLRAVSVGADKADGAVSEHELSLLSGAVRHD